MASPSLTFGARLRAARRMLNLTQVELGSIVGCHRSHIGLIELGLKNPGPVLRYQLLRTLKLRDVK